MISGGLGEDIFGFLTKYCKRGDGEVVVILKLKKINNKVTEQADKSRYFGFIMINQFSLTSY